MVVEQQHIELLRTFQKFKAQSRISARSWGARFFESKMLRRWLGAEIRAVICSQAGCFVALPKRFCKLTHEAFHRCCHPHLEPIFSICITLEGQHTYTYTTCRSSVNRPRRCVLPPAHLPAPDGCPLLPSFATRLIPTLRQHLPSAPTTRAETLLLSSFSATSRPSPPTSSAAHLRSCTSVPSVSSDLPRPPTRPERQAPRCGVSTSISFKDPHDGRTL